MLIPLLIQVMDYLFQIPLRVINRLPSDLNSMSNLLQVKLFTTSLFNTEKLNSTLNTELLHSAFSDVLSSQFSGEHLLDSSLRKLTWKI
jgi:hypothetical protein